MLKKLTCLLVFQLCFPLMILAQSSSLRLGLASPTAASLGKFGEVPVNLYTGKPNITVPIFEVKGRDLTLSISLSYDASGIKVEEIPGWVGLGWALNTGGVITRTVRGLPDELNNVLSQGYYYSGHLLQGNNWSTPRQTYLDSVDKEHYDSLPDLFFFNFTGKSGQFVLGYNGEPIRTIPHQKLLIIPTIGANDISKWEIITDDGTRYIFADKEVTLDTSIVWGFTPVSSPGRSFTSSWYLSAIYSPVGNDSIKFKYTTPVNIHHDLRTYLENRYLIPSVGPISNNPIDSIKVENRYTLQAIFLDSIITATAKLKFVISPRADFPGEFKLDTIKVFTSTGQLNRQFIFNYSYFNSQSNNKKRLRLDSVTEHNNQGTSLPSYKFEYDTLESLPSIDSNAMDYWGYYNGKTTNPTLVPSYESTTYNVYIAGADRRPDAQYLTAGLLKKIWYPTGGYTAFTYEAHDYSRIGTSPMQLVTTNYGTPYQFIANASFGYPDTTKFRVNSTDSVRACIRVDLNQTANNPNNNLLAKVILQTATGTEIKSWQSFNVDTIIESFKIPADSLWLIAISDSSGGYFSTAYAKIDYEVVDSAKIRIAGGVRINKIVSYDGIDSTKNIVRKYIYKTLSENDTTLSSGVLVNDLHFFSEKSINNKNYLTLSSASKNPIGITQGIHIGYTEVTVLYGENGEYGQRTHHFRSPLQAPDLMPEGPPGTTFFENGGVTSRDWKRGQLVSSEEFDSSGNLKRKLQNSYTFHGDTLSSATHRYLAMAVKWTGQTIPGQTPPNDKVFSSNSYEMVSGWVYKDNEVITIYGLTANDSIEINKDFFYDNPNHIQLTKTVETNTDGTQRITEFKYPEDYPNTSGSTDPYVQAIDSMKAKNMHSRVIEKVVYEKKAGQSQQVMSAELNLYKEFAPGQILPYQRLLLSSSTPVTNFTPSGVVSDTFNYDSRYLVQETLEQYDSYGNLLLRKDANNVPTASKWGYNASLLVGRVGKALPSQTVLSVFDDGDDGDWSGSAGTWVIQKGVYQQTDGNTTGPWTNPRYNPTASLDDGVFEADIRFDNAGTYRYAGIAKYLSPINLVRFELRKTDARVRISATKNGATIMAESSQTFNENQWYHLRGEIQGMVAKLYLDGVLLVTLNNGNVDLGSGQIGLCTYGTKASFDNVRMYPSDALAFSSSYDPVFLTINTQTDESGNSTLFSFDSFGRLIAIKDLQGNIFQKISYFYSRSASANDTFDPANPNYVQERRFRSGTDSTVTTTYFDGLGRKFQTQMRKGASDIVQHFTYDSRGRKDKVYKAFEQNTSHQYLAVSQFLPGVLFEDTNYEPNPLDRISQVIPFGGTSTSDITFAYDTGLFDGQTYHFVETTNENEIRKKEYFDKFDQRIAVVEAAGTTEEATTRFSYDVLGNLLRVVAPMGDTTQYTYDSRSLLQQKSSPDFNTIKYRYDRQGNLRFQQTAVQSAANQFTYFKYDSLNRVIEEGVWNDASIFDDPTYYEDPTWPTSTASTWKIRRYYDEDFVANGVNYSLGRLTKTEVNTDGDSAAEIITRFRYDRFGRIIEKRQQIEALSEKVFTFQYDWQGNLVKTIYPSGTTVDRIYNGQNQLDTVKAPY